MSTEPPTVPDPPARQTTLERIVALEERIAAHETVINQLLDRHNQFVKAMTDELGL